MEQIETEARPVLIPLIQHEDAELGPLEKETLARWATLRVMMAQFLDPPGRPKAIRAERYHRFYEARELPPRSQVWIARRNGEGPWPGAIVRLGEGMKPFLIPTWPEIDPSSWPPVGLLGERGLHRPPKAHRRVLKRSGVGALRYFPVI
jgi:hypothetical protein